MAMNWLKGLVAPAAEFPGQGGGMQQQGMQQQPGGPPVGGSPYGVQGQQPPQNFQPGPAIQENAGYVPPQWSTGTRTQGEAQGISKPATQISGGVAQQQVAQPTGAAAPDVAQLQRDLESMALFARTLLTMLEEKNIVTRAEFEATKNRLDMMDGKLDDR